MKHKIFSIVCVAIIDGSNGGFKGKEVKTRAKWSENGDLHFE